MYRELYEEVGLGKDDINIVDTSKEWITYYIPKSIRSYVLGGKLKGQIQKWYFVDLISSKEKVDLTSMHARVKTPIIGELFVEILFIADL